nr:MAG TPA: hypothetical protein [Caudoviricetes sp.]DAS78478.1 MAG TPA: hypothetical protein [Caudoviricetes sp.]
MTRRAGGGAKVFIFREIRILPPDFFTTCRFGGLKSG